MCYLNTCKASVLQTLEIFFKSDIVALEPHARRENFQYALLLFILYYVWKIFKEIPSRIISSNIFLKSIIYQFGTWSNTLWKWTSQMRYLNIVIQIGHVVTSFQNKSKQQKCSIGVVAPHRAKSMVCVFPRLFPVMILICIVSCQLHSIHYHLLVAYSASWVLGSDKKERCTIQQNV